MASTIALPSDRTPFSLPGLVAGLLGIGYVWLLSYRFPLAVTADGTVFLELARHLMEGRGLNIQTSTGEFEAITHWPPLYPMILSLVSTITGLRPLAAARIVSALSLGIGLWCLDYILVLLGHTARRRAIGLGLVGISLPFEMYLEAMSEGVFITLMLLMILSLLRWEERQKLTWLFVAGVFAGLMLLTRYAGLGFIAGAGLFMLFDAETWEERFKRAGAFGLPAGAFLLAWLIYASTISDNPVNRTFQLHLVSLFHLYQLGRTALSWLSPGFTFLGTGIAVGVAWLFLRLPRARVRRIYDAANLQLFIWMGVMYGAFLMVSISFFDFHTPLNNRILAPAFPLLICLLLPMASLFDQKIDRLTAGIIMGAMGFSMLGGFLDRSYLHFSEGQGYTGKTWLESPTLARLPEDKIVYSNARDAIRLLTHRSSGIYSIPLEVIPFDQQQNPAFRAEMDAMEEQIRSGKAILLYFDTLERYYLPDCKVLQDELAGVSVQSLADGVVIGE